MKIRNGFVSNSSTSSFICNTNLNADEVKEKLHELLNFYNNFFNENLNFQEVFSDPFEADNEYCSNGWEKYYDEIKNAKGKIIIEGADDNSIPYLLHDIIEERFDAKRCHLG